MKVDKVSREVLRLMGVGATATFELPSYAKVESAQVQLSILARREGKRYSYTTEGNTMTITRKE